MVSYDAQPDPKTKIGADDITKSIRKDPDAESRFRPLLDHQKAKNAPMTIYGQFKPPDRPAGILGLLYFNVRALRPDRSAYANVAPNARKARA